MADSPPSESVNLLTTNVTESSSFNGTTPLPTPPTQTLDRYSSFFRPKVDDHARARILSDEIAQQPSETQHEEEEGEDIGLSELSESRHEEGNNEALKSAESLEGFEEPVLSPLATEDDAVTEPSSPLAVGDSTDNFGDETDAWISYNQSQTEDCKPLLSIASGSSSWYDDVYEKPSMVGAGLANLGNTCFLNAVLQCFTHTILLVQGLYSYTQVMPCDCNGERFCLLCALWEHIEISLSSTGKIVFPLKLVDNLSYFSSSFRRFQQEDAHEFLQCFLDRLETSFSNLKLKHDALCLQNNNLVKQLFGGRIVSRLRCCNCYHCSDTYEPSVDLSLEIEDANNLSAALQSFTKVEHIGDEEMTFTCEKCKEKVSVQKQLMLDQTPPICALHLKRFKNDGCYVEKIDKHVEFPLELDLQPYRNPHSWSSNVDSKYELYAVVIHAAFTSTCGHYYCYIRSEPGTWYKFDDSKVTRVSESCVLSEEAYILFYARQGTPWFSNFMEAHKLSLGTTIISNTSPKSVLDQTSSPDSTSNHSHEINETNKAEDCIFSESLDRSRDTISKISKAQDHPSQSLQDSSNNVVGIQKNAHVTLTRHDRVDVIDSKDDKNEDFTTRLPGPSYSSEGTATFDIGKAFSPLTPPGSPGLDLSDNENSEVVFAPKPDQLKSTQKSSFKRLRPKDFDDSAKVEALRMCKKMPGARGSLLMAALDVSSKSKGSLNKKSKKMVLSPSPRKSRRRSSDRFKHRPNSISRNLATSSFR